MPLHPEDRPDPPRRPQVVQRRVDLGERPPRRDEPLEVEPPGLPEGEKPRDVAHRVRAAERAAEELLLGEDEERRGGDGHGVADRRSADADDRAAGARGQQARLDEARAADGVEGVVGADAGERLRPRRDVIGGGIDQVGRAEAAGLAGYEASTWQGFVLPAATPQPVVQRLARETATVVGMNDVRDRLRDQGYEPVGSSPAEFGAYIKAELAKWTKVIRNANIKGE